MRIIGGHDYYDSGLAFGQDSSILFLRNGNRRLSDEELQELLDLPRTICSGRVVAPGNDHPTNDRYKHFLRCRHAFENIEVDRVRHEFQVAHVILCGRLYNGLRIVVKEPYGFSREIETRWIWSVEALRHYASDYGFTVIEGRDGKTQDWDFVRSVQVRVDITVQTLTQWFSPQRLPDSARSRMVEERLTMITYDPSLNTPQDADRVYRRWRVDQPTLANMQFAKAVDPYTAFQEISMWVGGVIGSYGPNTVEITDNRIKIEKHGFDNRTSFRKAPSK